jgi:hypothetical protein
MSGFLNPLNYRVTVCTARTIRLMYSEIWNCAASGNICFKFSVQCICSVVSEIFNYVNPVITWGLGVTVHPSQPVRRSSSSTSVYLPIVQIPWDMIGSKVGLYTFRPPSSYPSFMKSVKETQMSSHRETGTKFQFSLRGKLRIPAHGGDEIC